MNVTRPQYLRRSNSIRALKVKLCFSVDLFRIVSTWRCVYKSRQNLYFFSSSVYNPVASLFVHQIPKLQEKKIEDADIVTTTSTDKWILTACTSFTSMLKISLNLADNLVCPHNNNQPKKKNNYKKYPYRDERMLFEFDPRFSGWYKKKTCFTDCILWKSS